MANIEKRERVRRLVSRLNRDNRAYYNDGRPLRSDSDYDEDKAMLRKLCPNHKLLGSVGHKPDTKETITRKIIMGSLNNARNEEELVTWMDRYSHIRKFAYSPKVDGLAVELVYRDHELCGGYTRGDGMTGTDVTAAVFGIPSIPRYLDFDGLWVVRGEAYITFEDFKRINVKLEGYGIEPFTLPRSMASGALKLVDPIAVRSRRLSFIAWELVTGKRKRMVELTKETQRMSFMKDMMELPVVPRRIFDRDTMSVRELLEQLAIWRKELPYPIDGIVFSVNSIKELERNDDRFQKFPKGKIAYKFPPHKCWSRVTKIVDQVGRTGKITPVVHFNPIIIDGSEVKKASAHNYDEIKRLHMTRGCKVQVEKACEIIPQIVRVESASDPEEIIPPTECPRCSSKLIQKETTSGLLGTTVDLFCPNTLRCPAQIDGRLVNFLSIIGTLGFGPKVAHALSVKISGIAGIFELEERDFRRVISPNLGNKLYKELHNKKKVEFAQFIQSLGYEQIGEQVAKIVAVSFINVKSLLECDCIDQIKLNLVAGGLTGDVLVPTVSRALFNGLEEIAELAKHLTIKPYVLNKKGNTLEGLLIAITGSLTKDRKVFAKMIEDYGGRYSASVTRKVTHLVIGEGGGGKREDAQKLGIKVITEAQLLSMIN